jgi:hypothetical protein
MMSSFRVLASAFAFSGAVMVASFANAFTITLDVNVDGQGVSVVSTPTNDLAAATSASAASWSVGSFTLAPPLAGAVTSFSLSNPILLSPSALGTNTLTIVIGGVTYHDTLTETANPFDAIVMTGELTGGTLGANTSVFDLSFTQAGGTGRLISASGTYEVTTSTVPETSTWAMMVLGFVGLGYAAFRKGAKGKLAVAV